MGRIINLDEYREEAKTVIPLEKTEAFHKAAKELDEFISSLPVGQYNSNKLTQLIIKQIQIGQQDAFTQGFRMGMEFAKWDMENPED